jgi:hypothetical protein
MRRRRHSEAKTSKFDRDCAEKALLLVRTRFAKGAGDTR